MNILEIEYNNIKYKVNPWSFLAEKCRLISEEENIDRDEKREIYGEICKITKLSPNGKVAWWVPDGLTDEELRYLDYKVKKNVIQKHVDDLRAKISNEDEFKKLEPLFIALSLIGVS